jgi:hypothetical protein
VIRLNRIKLLLLGVVLIAAFYFARQLTYILHSERTTGEVIAFTRSSSRKGGGYYTYPVVKYETDSFEVHFTAEPNLDYSPGDKVPVIHDKKNLLDAEIYTFFGFWFSGLIWFIMIFLVWLAFATSYLGKKEVLQINLRSFSFRKKKDDNNDRNLDGEWPDKLKLE